MILARFTVGPFAENVYVVGVPPRVAVVDPGGESERVMEAIDREGWQPEAILLTHAHIDHIAHCAHVAERYRIGVTVHRDDLPGGDAQTLVRSIRERLFALDGDYTCWPGHGAETTLSEERRDNPFVGQGAVAF